MMCWVQWPWMMSFECLLHSFFFLSLLEMHTALLCVCAHVGVVSWCCRLTLLADSNLHDENWVGGPARLLASPSACYHSKHRALWGSFLLLSQLGTWNHSHSQHTKAHAHTHTIKDLVAQLYLDTSPDWSLPSSPFTAPGSAFAYCSWWLRCGKSLWNADCTSDIFFHLW